MVYHSNFNFECYTERGFKKPLSIALGAYPFLDKTAYEPSPPRLIFILPALHDVIKSHHAQIEMSKPLPDNKKDTTSHLFFLTYLSVKYVCYLTWKPITLYD